MCKWYKPSESAANAIAATKGDKVIGAIGFCVEWALSSSTPSALLASMSNFGPVDWLEVRDMDADVGSSFSAQHFG